MSQPQIVSPEQWDAARAALWFSSAGSDFNQDFGVTTADGREGFGLSVLLRDGDDIFRTYFTASRGVDRLRSTSTCST